jgi:hypothetical protein
MPVLVGLSLVCCQCLLPDLCSQRGGQLCPGELAKRIPLTKADANRLVDLRDHIEAELLQRDVRIQ